MAGHEPAKPRTAKQPGGDGIVWEEEVGRGFMKTKGKNKA
jgi:hypothetical protein